MVGSYDDMAAAVMARDGTRARVSTVTLRPHVVWFGTSDAEIALHHAAHDECFNANSIKTDVHCEPA